MIVDHHMGQYVALPFRPANENLYSDSLYVVETLGVHAVKGRGLDKSALTCLNLGEWSKDMTISTKAENSTPAIAGKDGRGQDREDKEADRVGRGTKEGCRVKG